MKISIIIPVLNESELLEAQLAKLQPAREEGHEVILVDASSDTQSRVITQPWVDKICESEPGRARQMNLGAEVSTGDVLLFLHIDTTLPQNFTRLLYSALEETGSCWGRFDIELSGRAPAYRVIEGFMNWRSHLTGVATGDQAIFIRSRAFAELSGFALIPLMEDIELSKRLRKRAWPARIRVRAGTSSRRWEHAGIGRTVLLMWWLRLLYFLGISPEKLVRMYYK